MELIDLPLFPLGSVLFPGFGVQLHIFEERYKQMVADCLSGSPRFGILGIERGVEVGDTADPYQVGTLVQITQLEELAEGRFSLVAAGLERFQVLDLAPPGKLYLRGRVRLWPDEADPPPTPASVERAGALFNDYLSSLVAATGSDAAAWGIRLPLDLPADPRRLSLLIGALIQVPAAEKQQLLEAPSPGARLASAITLLTRELTLMKTTGAAPRPNAAGLLGSFSDN
ncbi:MAG TPA: LON peptidase substrate-binding domain-containing protein [Chloroflexia bacterium]|nr:LON peptidase substrate-binding domain-containing protein [Chloroflexia bacterium]